MQTRSIISDNTKAFNISGVDEQNRLVARARVGARATEVQELETAQEVFAM